MNPRVLLRGILLIVSLVTFGYLLEVTELGSHLDKAWIDTEVRGKGFTGALLFVAAGTLFTGIGLPRQMIGFLGGYAFGFLWGTVFSLAATALGCIASFFYARWLGRSLIKARFPERIRRLDDFISGNPFSMTLLIRLLPVGSNLATNLAAGVTRVSPMAFFLGSALGYVPQNAVFALAGSGINLNPVFRISLATALFIISALLGVYLYRRFRHGRSFDRAVDQELGEAPASGGAPNT